ncbi:class B sortase [Caproiciproducens sp. NJN-50]|uniref:class B sortase n=1 Tax=Acutalibacteraceae TaxID=3082771 RepID=UPI000FFE27D9|nr:MULTISPECIES: class B sortase [Acutalibacteraceae]QAT48636.1 class B sortase [Caproiciproducens sp. NJN-50]
MKIRSPKFSRRFRRIGSAVRRGADRLKREAFRRTALLKEAAFRKTVLLKEASFRQNAWHAVFFLSLCAFAVCCGILFHRLYTLPKQSDEGLAKARSLYRGASSSVPQSSSSASFSSAPEEKKLSFSELQAANRDVKGWITIPGTAIDDPVLCPPKDRPDYYLTHDWEGNETKYGSIFLYSGSTSQKNIILYGHSMKDGRMFAPLLDYQEPRFYDLHPVIQFRLGNDTAAWKIFAVIKVNTDPSQGEPFDYQKTKFASPKDFSDFLGRVRIRSVLNIPVDLKTSDTLLTLSTCSYEFDGFRTVIFARRLRRGENASVDTPKVSENAGALYPDCWYAKFGGKRP